MQVIPSYLIPQFKRVEPVANKQNRYASPGIALTRHQVVVGSRWNGKGINATKDDHPRDVLVQTDKCKETYIQGVST